MDKWGLVYWKVGRNKIISKYRLSKILLDAMTNKIM